MFSVVFCPLLCFAALAPLCSGGTAPGSVPSHTVLGTVKFYFLDGCSRKGAFASVPPPPPKANEFVVSSFGILRRNSVLLERDTAQGSTSPVGRALLETIYNFKLPSVRTSHRSSRMRWGPRLPKAIQSTSRSSKGSTTFRRGWGS